MSNQDLVLGFKLSTLWLWVSSYNHKTDAPTLKRSNFFVGFEPVAGKQSCIVVQKPFWQQKLQIWKQLLSQCF